MRYTRSFLLVFLTLLPLIGALSQPNFGVTRLSSTRFPLYGSHDVTVAGNLLFVSEDSSIVSIFDITNPSYPEEVGIYSAYCWPSNIVVNGNIAYLPNGSQGIDIVDFSNPTNPVRIGRAPIAQNTYSIARRGNYLYIGEYNNNVYQIRVLDVTNPTLPVQVTTTAAYPHAESIVIAGDIAYITATNTLYIVSIANPLTFQTLGSIPLPNAGKVTALSDNYAYAACGDSGMVVLDVTNPASPSTVTVYDTPGSVYDVKVFNNVAYVCDGVAGLKILNVSNPLAPILIGNCDTPGAAYRVGVAGNFVYVQDGWSSGIRVINATNLSSPIDVNHFGLPGYVSDITVRGNYVYFTDTVYGIRIVDVSNPATPLELGECQTFRNSWSFALSGNYAYVATGDSGIAIVNVSNPNSPQFVRYFGNSGYGGITGVSVAGSHLFFVKDGRFQVYDVTDPVAPTLLSTSTFYVSSSRMIATGNYVYILGSSEPTIGLLILDVTNPESPSIVGRFALPSVSFYYSGLAVTDDLVYNVDVNHGLRILRVTDPTHPQLVAHYEPTNSFSGIAVSGNVALLGGSIYGERGLRVLDVSNPATPNLIGYFDESFPLRITVMDNIVYSGESLYLRIYDCTEAMSIVSIKADELPSEYSLYPCYPNPFNATATIEYAVPKTGKVELRLYDVTGKEVSTLVNFDQNPGTYRVTFDGKSLSSGTYFVRMQAGNYVKTQKITLLK